MRITASSVQSLTMINASKNLVGFSVQNLSATIDIYFSDDQRALDTVDSTNTPTSGHKLTGGAGNQGILIFQWPFYGTLYCRAVSGTPQLEVQPYYGIATAREITHVDENIPSLSNN